MEAEVAGVEAEAEVAVEVGVAEEVAVVVAVGGGAPILPVGAEAAEEDPALFQATTTTRSCAPVSRVTMR